MVKNDENMIRKLKLKSFWDERGGLTACEVKDVVDFEIRRFYFISNPKGKRGEHAIINEKKIYVLVAGHMDAHFHDGKEWRHEKMSEVGEAIVIESFLWREFDNFSEDAILLCLSSLNYEECEYINNFEEFVIKSKSL